MASLKWIFATLGLAFFTISNAHTEDCPDLTTKTIGDAACATATDPFSSSALAKVRFYATTPCPSSMWKKKVQDLFKGTKTYKRTKANVVKEGKVSCTYLLDADWQVALGVKDTQNQLKLIASLPHRDHANRWEAPSFGAKCPTLVDDKNENTARYWVGVSDIKDGKLVVESDLNGATLSYIFEPELQKAGFATRGMRAIGKKNELKNLAGTAALEEPFQVECEYIHKTSGKETVLHLTGTNKAELNQSR